MESGRKPITEVTCLSCGYVHKKLAPVQLVCRNCYKPLAGNCSIRNVSNMVRQEVTGIRTELAKR